MARSYERPRESARGLRPLPPWLIDELARPDAEGERPQPALDRWVEPPPPDPAPDAEREERGVIVIPL